MNGQDNMDTLWIAYGVSAIANNLKKKVIEDKITRVKSLEIEIAKAKDQGIAYDELEKLLMNEKQELKEYLFQQNLKEKQDRKSTILIIMFAILASIICIVVAFWGISSVSSGEHDKTPNYTNYSNTSQTEVTQKVYVGYTTSKQCQYCHQYLESDAYLKIHINEYHPKYATSIKLYFDKRLKSYKEPGFNDYKNDYNGSVMAWSKGVNVYSDNIYNIILDNSKSDEINIIEYRFNNKFIKGTPYFYFKIDSKDFKEALSGIESFCFFEVFGSQNQTIPEVYKIYLNNLNEYDDNYYCINLLQDVVLNDSGYWSAHSAEGFGIRICVNPNTIVKFKEMFLSSEGPSD